MISRAMMTRSAASFQVFSKTVSHLLQVRRVDSVSQSHLFVMLITEISLHFSIFKFLDELMELCDSGYQNENL
jgi:hypothetical protein